MHTTNALNKLRPPEMRVEQRKQPGDFNRPKVRWGGKVYSPEHPMYESVRRMILDRYKQ